MESFVRLQIQFSRNKLSGGGHTCISQPRFELSDPRFIRKKMCWKESARPFFESENKEEMSVEML